MQIIDLSPVLHANTPHFPGDLPFRLNQIKDGGFCTGDIAMSLHTGSHTDFAVHCGVSGALSHEISLEYFIGPAVCISVSANLAEAIKFIPPDNPKNAKILLLNVKFKPKNEADFFINSPFLDDEFLNLAHKSGFQTIATNLSTIDKFGSNSRHLQAFALKLQIIECLINLDVLQGREFLFCAAPLKIAAADAAPLRAVAIV